MFRPANGNGVNSFCPQSFSCRLVIGRASFTIGKWRRLEAGLQGTATQSLTKLFQERGWGALAGIGKAGILPDVSAEKLLVIAKIAYEEFDGDLRALLKKPLPQAKKALKRFPSIGDPGAEKILLLTRSCPVMALDSNGLRVLCRVGFAEEQKIRNYINPANKQTI